MNLGLCDKCKINDAGTHFVPGEGDKNARVMFIGEAPGAEEDLKRRPFIGKAGLILRDLLDKYMKGCSYFITNTCFCRPPENRTPTKTEIKCCFPNLEREIRSVKPIVIVTLGGTALKALTNKGKVGAFHGGVLYSKFSRPGAEGWRNLVGEDAKDRVTNEMVQKMKEDDHWHPLTFCTFHPSAINYNAEVRPLLKRDIQRVRKLALGQDHWRIYPHLIEGRREAVSFMQGLLSEKRIVFFDLETSCLSPWEKDARVLVVSFCVDGENSYCIPFHHPESPFPSEFVKAKLEPLFIKLLTDPSIRKGNHNLVQFDEKFVEVVYGIKVQGESCDSIVESAALTQETYVHGLKSLAWKKTSYGGYDYEIDLFFKGGKNRDFSKVPLKTLSRYSCFDPCVAHRIHHSMSEELDEDKSKNWLYTNVLSPVAQELKVATENGILIDQKYGRKLDRVFGRCVVDLESRILASESVTKLTWKRCRTDEGFVFNPGSSVHLNDLFFGQMRIRKPRLVNNRGKLVIPRTKAGLISLDVECLLAMLSNAKESGYKEAADIISDMIMLRRAAKMFSTYVKPWIAFADSNSRVHPSFILHGTKTGRISSSDPNSQNFPGEAGSRMPELEEFFKRMAESDEIGKLLATDVRGLIVAPPGWVIVHGDFSQIELRILAHISNDRALIRAFKSGADIHTATASEFLSVPIDKVTPEQRRFAKTINFGVVYGSGVHAIAKKIRKSYDETRELIYGKYFGTFRGVRGFQREAERYLREHKTSFPSLFGETRPLPAIDSGILKQQRGAIRQAINSPIQGTAGRLTLFAIVNICEEARRQKLQFKLFNTVHDSIDFYVPKGIADRFCCIMKERMEDCSGLPFRFKVPIIADVNVGTVYSKLKKVEFDESV